MMDKEKFKEYIEKCGGIETFVKCREDFMNLVCAIDEVIELDAKIDSIEVSGEEIFRKVANMTALMGCLID